MTYFFFVKFFNKQNNLWTFFKTLEQFFSTDVPRRTSALTIFIGCLVESLNIEENMQKRSNFHHFYLRCADKLFFKWNVPQARTTELRTTALECEVVHCLTSSKCPSNDNYLIALCLVPELTLHGTIDSNVHRDLQNLKRNFKKSKNRALQFFFNFELECLILNAVFHNDVLIMIQTLRSR